ncbi:peroxidase family protein [Bauldia sp.]|uniref:peroxidase family protein n=1 Tax=Bauldia sp. TaxID=2575872 RepID=UPI003BAD9037
MAKDGESKGGIFLGWERPVDGVGTVAEHEDHGAVGQSLLRLADANFDDGIGALAEAGRPNPREISNAVVAQQGDEPNELGASAFLFAWGQFIDHDIDLTEAGGLEYAPIAIPDDDPVFAGGEIPFFRVEPVHGTGDTTPREYENEITAFIDASMVYGSDDGTYAALRDEGGKMLIDENGLLYSTGGGVLAGDVRAAENAALTSLHTLFIREHNRWVDKLAKKNPELTGEELYWTARSYVETEIQAITYNEFLPILVGEDMIAAYSGYDPSVNPGVSVEFSTAAFRFGHSLINPTLQRLEENGETSAAGDLSLLGAFFAPDTLADGGFDAMLRGLGDSVSQEVDTHVIEELRSFLFGAGLDLPAFNIQRGRDLGVASYNDLREAVGLDRATSFADVTSNAELAAGLEAVYGDVDALDAWVGGLAEDHVNGGLLGELFSVIVIDQFTRLRDGDPYWSEGSDMPAKELDELWSTTLSDIIERNSDIGVMQDNAFIAYDRIGGDDGANLLEGGDGHDLLLGQGGKDTLVGNGDDDQLVGGRGSDIINGGAGNDVLEGGAGADVFVFAMGEAGDDVIVDFDKKDQVDLTDFDEFAQFDDLDLVKGDGGATLILADDQTVSFEGVGIGKLKADDFLLA